MLISGVGQCQISTPILFEAVEIHLVTSTGVAVGRCRVHGAGNGRVMVVEWL